jgi:hypothetical protein|tara:strand:- start:17512 stop:18120 length:609 start_codon:yes stop_codon:yes gene_type:complete
MFTSEIIIAFITGVLGPVLLLVIKNIIDKRNSPKPDMVLDALKVGKLVESKIEDIKDEFKPDRVWITQFHNGGHFYPTGKSIAKFSVMYETVGTGVSSIQQNFQNIPVNLFSKSMNQLVSNETIEIPDYKDETIATYGLKYIAQDTGCKSGYLFAIRTIDDKFIGVLGLDYTKRKTKLDDDVINSLIVYSSSLGGVLMNGEL